MPDVGITALSVHLPLHRLPDKELAAAGLARGHTALRVPWWDEDPLTLAVEAGLRLRELPAKLERIHLALDDHIDQPGLAALALGLDLPVLEHAGPDAGLEALLGAGKGPALVLAGGTRLGGTGVAALVEPAQGARITGTASAWGNPLGDTDGPAVGAALTKLGGDGPLLVPAGRLDRRALPSAAESGVTGAVGDAGAASALLALAGGLASSKKPFRLATVSRGNALALAVRPSKDTVVTGLDAPAHDTTVAAWRALSEAPAEPWAEASQGAYVSSEEYDADPVARYGARAAGHGTVEAVTTVYAGPPGEFLRQHDAAGPYDVAIVALEKGGRRIAQSTAPPGTLAIGDRVAFVLRRLFSMEGTIRYALKVLPAP